MNTEATKALVRVSNQGYRLLMSLGRSRLSNTAALAVDRGSASARHDHNRLRESGIRSPVLLFRSLRPFERASYLRLDLMPPDYS